MPSATGGAASNSVKVDDAQASTSKETPAASTAPAPAAKADAVNAGDKQTATILTSGNKESAEAMDTANVLTPDANLLSVLQDLSKQLKEGEAIKSINDPVQRLIADLAREAMEKALNGYKSMANRIVEGRGKDGSMPAMTTESWASGDLELTNQCHASLAAIWAKQENGLVNVTVAGRCLDRVTSSGKPIGEFVVVLSGRSPVERGFDIQSQNNVHFWLGKVQSISVESDCSIESRRKEATSNQSMLSLAAFVTGSRALPAVLTERSRNFLSTRKVFTDTELTKSLSSVSPDSPLPEGMTVKQLQQAYQKALRELAINYSRAADKPANAHVLPSRKPDGFLSDDTGSRNSLLLRLPSKDACLVAPDRALAGQPMTVSVIDSKNNVEAYVELSLNGRLASTDANGQHIFHVAEDATPGRSLNVGLAARPENLPSSIEILQPLAMPTGKETPKIEKVTCQAWHSDTIIVDGHNFDGCAGKDTIAVDGRVQGRVLAASPVQLRVNLPANLANGNHDLVVTCQDLSSNAVSFHFQGVTAMSFTKLERSPRAAASRSVHSGDRKTRRIAAR